MDAIPHATKQALRTWIVGLTTSTGRVHAATPPGELEATLTDAEGFRNAHTHRAATADARPRLRAENCGGTQPIDHLHNLIAAWPQEWLRAIWTRTRPLQVGEWVTWQHAPTGHTQYGRVTRSQLATHGACEVEQYSIDRLHNLHASGQREHLTHTPKRALVYSPNDHAPHPKHGALGEGSIDPTAWPIASRARLPATNRRHPCRHQRRSHGLHAAGYTTCSSHATSHSPRPLPRTARGVHNPISPRTVGGANSSKPPPTPNGPKN